MERFCDKCGSLVNGEGGFCPSCGARMSSLFDVGGLSSGGVDLSKRDTMPSASNAAPYSPVPMPTQTGRSYQGQSNYNNSQQPYNNQQSYGQPIYPQSNLQSQRMTMGQWLLTIFLSCLGFIGIVILFVWAFSASTPTAKKNYARAMLIIMAIVVALAPFVLPVFFGSLFVILRSLNWSEWFAALLMMFP